MHFPQYICLNKKGIQIRIILYILITLAFLWGLWIGTGKFFTEESYDSEMFFFMPIAILFMVYLIIKELIKLRTKDPVIILSNEGVQFTDKSFSEFGIVKWEHITSCYDENYGRYTEPCFHIKVSDNEFYISKIKDKKTRDAFRKLSNTKNGSLLWAEVRLLNCNIIELKKVIFKHIKK